MKRISEILGQKVQTFHWPIEPFSVREYLDGEQCLVRCLPAKTKVIFAFSFGNKSLNRDPADTKSTWV